MAAQKNIWQEVKTLLENGADAAAKDDHGRNPLHLAAMNNNVICVEALIDNHIKTGKNIIYAVDNNGNTPLHLAVANIRNDVIKILAKYYNEDFMGSYFDQVPLNKDGKKIPLNNEGKSPLDLGNERCGIFSGFSEDVETFLFGRRFNYAQFELDLDNLELRFGHRF